VTPGVGKTASIAPTKGFSVKNTQVTVNLTNVGNVQTLAINLIGVAGGARRGNVSIPMGVLLGDVNASGRVDGTDLSLVGQQNFRPLTQNPPTFREDIDASGRIDGTDASIAGQQSFTSLP
jgi:hypothetical protein